MARFLPRSMTASLWSSSSSGDSECASPNSAPTTGTRRSADAMSRLDALHTLNAHKHTAPTHDRSDLAVIRGCVARARRLQDSVTVKTAGARRIHMRASYPSDATHEPAERPRHSTSLPGERPRPSTSLPGDRHRWPTSAHLTPSNGAQPTTGDRFFGPITRTSWTTGRKHADPGGRAASLPSSLGRASSFPVASSPLTALRESELAHDTSLSWRTSPSPLGALRESELARDMLPWTLGRTQSEEPAVHLLREHDGVSTTCRLREHDMLPWTQSAEPAVYLLPRPHTCQPGGRHRDTMPDAACPPPLAIGQDWGGRLGRFGRTIGEGSGEDDWGGPTLLAIGEDCTPRPPPRRSNTAPPHLWQTARPPPLPQPRASSDISYTGLGGPASRHVSVSSIGVPTSGGCEDRIGTGPPQDRIGTGPPQAREMLGFVDSDWALQPCGLLEWSKGHWSHSMASDPDSRRSISVQRGFPLLLERALPTETNVESGTSQSKSGTSVNLSNSGERLVYIDEAHSGASG